MTKEEEIEAVAKGIYFTYVDSQGYPNGLPTWSEMPDRHLDKILAREQAKFAIEIIDHMRKVVAPPGDDPGKPSL